MKKILFALFFITGIVNAQFLTEQQIKDQWNTRSVPYPSTSTWHTLYSAGGKIDPTYQTTFGVCYWDGTKIVSGTPFTHNGTTIGIGTSPPTTDRVAIKSTGNTSASFALSISNSSNIKYVNFRDDRRIVFGDASNAAVIQYYDGNQGANKILQSDANGVGTWVSLSVAGAVSGSGTTNFIPKWSSSTALTNSLISDDGTDISVVGLTKIKQVGSIIGTSSEQIYMATNIMQLSTDLNAMSLGGVKISATNARIGFNIAGASKYLDFTTTSANLFHSKINIATNSTDSTIITGKLRFNNATQANGNVLVSNANGVASWKTLASAGVVAGTGTQFYIPVWSNIAGTTLGNSTLYEDASGITIGDGTKTVNLNSTRQQTQVTSGINYNIYENLNVNNIGDIERLSIHSSGRSTQSYQGVDSVSFRAYSNGSTYSDLSFKPAKFTVMRKATDSTVITGKFRFNNGTQSNGYVLTSNANGVASWQPAASVGVTSIATSYGLSGGTITSTGTLKLDTTSGTVGGSRLATQYYVGTHSGTGTVTSVATSTGLTGGTITTTGTLKADTNLLATHYYVNNTDSVGTITRGTWNAGVIPGLYGGTGIANSGKTITLGGNLVTSGAFATTLTTTATTTDTLPTTGTLYGTKSGSITSAQIKTSVSDETGGGLVVLNTTPTFITNITTPLVLGGTGTTQTLTYQTTSGVGATGADHIFKVGNNGATEAMRVLNNAQVSIGSATPYAASSNMKLTVTGDISNGGSDCLFLRAGGTAAGGGGGIKFGLYYNGGFPSWNLASIISAADNPAVGDKGSLMFYTSTGGVSGTGVLTEAFRITSSSNVGIGTSTVSARLHVISTTEQQRLGYDASNYFSTTVGSNGGVTLDAVGSGSAFTFSDLITPSAGIKGTITNDNATVGNTGQTTSSLVAVGSPVSLTTATAANITSISLTAGDWLVSGNVNFTETVATVSARSAGISSTSATLPTDGSESYCGVQSTLVTETNTISLTSKRFSLSGTTTVYLVGNATFSAGTCGGFGSITAVRIR